MTTNPLEIINRQILRWESERRSTDRQPSARREARPVVVVSSAYGSGGLAIAQRAANLLGFELYDRELVERIAASAHVREKVAESLDDRVQDWITEIISRQFETNTFTNSDFLQNLSRVVLSIAQHGGAVIVGRGAQFILDPRWVLRVRTFAALDRRIHMTMELDGVDAPTARSMVLRKDAERAGFCRLHFNQDVASPDHYDLLINTAEQPHERHAELIVYAFLLRFGQHSRRDPAVVAATL
jgi:cytidylate kinase